MTKDIKEFPFGALLYCFGLQSQAIAANDIANHKSRKARRKRRRFVKKWARVKGIRLSEHEKAAMDKNEGAKNALVRNGNAGMRGTI